MKSVGRIFCLSVLCSWLCLAAPFAAAERGHRPAGGREVAEHSPQERGARRAFDQDETQSDERRERLSPEDRLQLRRDVRDAGHDIYPDRPRRHDSRRR